MQDAINQEDQDFNNFMDLQNTKVKKNVEIVTPETLNQSFFLHIDNKIINNFIPMLSRRAALTEDNTVPRITVSDSLFGCIMGHSGTEHNFHKDPEQGFYINKIDFNYALKPNNKLVYDALETNEHWLITYNKRTIKYKAEVIGKMFIQDILYVRNGNKKSITDSITTFMIEISEDIDIVFKPGYRMKKGFYKLKLNITNWEDFELKKIQAKEYYDSKSLNAAILNQQDIIPNTPLFTRW